MHEPNWAGVWFGFDFKQSMPAHEYMILDSYDRRYDTIRYDMIRVTIHICKVPGTGTCRLSVTYHCLTVVRKEEAF